MRIFGIIVAILIILVAGALLAPSFINWNDYKPQIISQIESATGFDAEIGGEVNLAIFPMPHAVVNGLSLKHPSEGDAQLLTLDSADVYVEVGPLLSGNVAVKSVTLNRPEINLRKFENGEVNWMTETLQGGEQAQQEETADDSTGTNISIEKLSINDGLVTYTDAGSGSVQSVNNINADFSMDSLQGPFTLDGNFDYQTYNISADVTTKAMSEDRTTLPLSADIALGDGSAAISFSGVAGLGDEFDMQGDTGIDIENLRKLVTVITNENNESIPASAFRTSGILSASTSGVQYNNMTATLGETELSGSISASGFDAMPITITTDLSQGDNQIAGAVEYAPERVAFSDMNIAFAGSNATASGSWAMPQSEGGRGTLNLSLNASALNADRLMEEFGIEAGGSGGGHGGESSPEDMGQALKLPFDTDIDATIDRLVYDGKTYTGIEYDGTTSLNSADIQTASINDYAGIDGSVSGQIGNLNDLSGLELTVNGATDDLEGTIQSLGMSDNVSLPFKVGAVNGQAAINGNINRMQFDGQAEALRGTISASGTAQDVLAGPSFQGLAFGLKHPNLNEFLKQINQDAEDSPALARPVNLSASVDMSENVYKFNNLDGAFGPVQMSGNLSADTSGEIPSLNGALKLGNLPLDDLLPETGQSGTQVEGGSSERWSKDPIDTGFLHSANADLDITAGNVTYGDWAFAQPSFNFTMEDGRASVNGFTAGLFNGTAKADLSVFAPVGNNKPVTISTNANLDNVGLQSLVTALAGKALVQSQGVVDFEADLEATGPSMAQLINNLNGSGQVNGTDVTIQGIDLAKLSRAMIDTDSLGRQALGLFRGGISGGATRFEEIDGDFSVNNGIVNFDPLTLTGQDAVMTVTGDVSLPAWTMDIATVVNLTEPEDAPPLEMSFRGSLDNPAQSMAQGAVQNYLNQKIGNKVNDLIGDKLGDDSELGGIVGGLLGIKPKNDNQPPQEETAEPEARETTADENPTAETQEAPTTQTEENRSGDTVPTNVEAEPLTAPSNDNEPATSQEETAPAESETASEPQEQGANDNQPEEEQDPEDVVKDVLKGFMGGR